MTQEELLAKEERVYKKIESLERQIEHQEELLDSYLAERAKSMEEEMGLTKGCKVRIINKRTGQVTEGIFECVDSGNLNNMKFRRPEDDKIHEIYLRYVNVEKLKE